MLLGNYSASAVLSLLLRVAYVWLTSTASTLVSK